MEGKKRTPQYAIRLVVIIVFAGVVFFGGLRLFIPEGSKLTGSYDAESLLYIASAPVSYSNSEACGSVGCHESLFKKWSEGAHGARAEKSKCEVCHGPQGKHPEKDNKLPMVRGDGNLVELCLSCHRQLKARSTTGQPQIVPQQHPYPHEGELKCTQCHDPHSPGINAPVAKNVSNVSEDKSNDKPVKGETSAAAKLAENCFSCHGAEGRGGFAPAIAGQPTATLKDKLKKYKSGETKSQIMNPIVKDMKDEDIDALAQYFSEVSK